MLIFLFLCLAGAGVGSYRMARAALWSSGVLCPGGGTAPPHEHIGAPPLPSEPPTPLRTKCRVPSGAPLLMLRSAGLLPRRHGTCWTWHLLVILFTQ